jgi:hypothetical protein
LFLNASFFSPSRLLFYLQLHIFFSCSFDMYFFLFIIVFILSYCTLYRYVTF